MTILKKLQYSHKIMEVSSLTKGTYKANDTHLISLKIEEKH